MKTLQEKYNAVLEGNFPKSQFVRDAKMEVPRFISPYNGFEDTVQILKNKGMLIEAKAETPEYDKPAPGYPLEALERGVDYELEKMGLMSNETVSEEDYAKAKKKAEKNLEKDVNHYLHLLSGDSKKVDKHDREVEVDQKKLFKGTVDPKGGKAEGNTDTFNAMKKATLREAAMAKGYTKEQVEAAIKRLSEKKVNEYTDYEPGTIAPADLYFSDKHGKLVAMDDVDDKYWPSLKGWLVVKKGDKVPDPMDEKKGKVDEGDPIVDEHEFDFFKEILDGRYKDEDIEEYLKSDDYQQALQTLNLDASDTEEWIGEFTNFFGDGADAYIDEGNIKEAVKKVIKHVLKENHQSLDLEVGRRIEGLLDQKLKAKFLEAGKDLIKDLTNEDQFNRNDVVSHLANELNLHVPIRDLFKEEALNERVGGLQEFINLIQDRAVDSGFPEEEEAMEVIEAIAEHYGIKIQIGGLVGEKKVTEEVDFDVFSDTIQVVGYPKTVEDALKVIDRYEKDREAPVSREEAEELIADMRATDEDDFDRNITNLIEKAFNIKLKGVSEKTLEEEEIPFKKIYKADFNEIKEYLLKKLNSKHDGHVVDGVLKELFESAENLVDEQPGTSELDAVYSVAENLEDIYYEEEKDEEYKIANEISKILEPIYNA